MKKFFAALLATAMVLSMASVSFAASGNSVKGWVSKYDKLNAYTDTKDSSRKTYYPVTQVIGPFQYEADAKVITDYSVEYGDSVYFLLVNGQGQLVTESKEAEAIKLKAKWELGGELVESMSIVRRKVTNPAFAYAGTYGETPSDPVSGLLPTSGVGTGEIKFDDRDKANKLHIFDGNDKIIKGWETLVPNNISYTTVSSSSAIGPNAGTFDPTDYGSALNGGNGYEYETIGGISRGKSYIYMMAIKIKGSTNVNDSDIIGELTINKSRDNKMDDLTLDLAMNVNWEKSYINYQELIIGDNGYDEEFEADINYALKFNGDDEVEFTFADESTFTVDISGQGKVLFNFNTKTDSKIASQYPLVEFNFWNGNGAKFNRTGEMFLNADVGYNTFLYQVMEDGTLGEVKGAVYDSADEGYYFKTRVLGQYVLSDTDLSDYNFRF